MFLYQNQRRYFYLYTHVTINNLTYIIKYVDCDKDIKGVYPWFHYVWFTKNLIYIRTLLHIYSYFRMEDWDVYTIEFNKIFDIGSSSELFLWLKLSWM